jgi:hypothetical protein
MRIEVVPPVAKVTESTRSLHVVALPDIVQVSTEGDPSCMTVTMTLLPTPGAGLTWTIRLSAVLLGRGTDTWASVNEHESRPVLPQIWTKIGLPSEPQPLEPTANGA